MTPTMPTLHAATLAALLSAAAIGQPAPTVPPPLDSNPKSVSSPPTKPAETKPAEPAKPKAPDAATETLLKQIEAADKTLKTLTARIQYTKFFPEIQGGGEHIWQGTLRFADHGTPKDATRPLRTFAVDFAFSIVDGAKRDLPEQYIFDGRWLLHKDHSQKQYTRTEIVIPGSDEDPLRIGEGPLPLPIGQKRDDMVARFELNNPGPLEGIGEGAELNALRALLEHTRQLRLVPIAGTREAKDFREIRIWYRTADGLPVFARTVNTDESRADVLLADLQRNSEQPAGAFSTEPPDGWKGESRPRPRPTPRTVPPTSDADPRSVSSPTSDKPTSDKPPAGRP